MAETDQIEPNFQPLPTIVYGKGVDPTLVVDPIDVAQTQQQLEISDEGIAQSAIYLDPKSRLLVLGTHYPGWLGRRRFRSVPELQGVQGDIIRVSTVVKGKQRTPDQQNHTLAHELEHQAQADRNDPNVKLGHLAIARLVVAGAIAGNRRGHGPVTKTVGTALGGVAGWYAGNVVAPHEIQARQRAREITTTAVKKSSTS